MAFTKKEIKERSWAKKKESALMIDCGCGCGEKLLNMDDYGRPRHYITGHNNRTSRSQRLKIKLITDYTDGKCGKCGLVYDGKNGAVFNFHHRDPGIDKPHQIFAEVVEAEAIEQFRAAMMLDTVVQGALMPDAHSGYTLPIGAVVAVKDYIYPSFVGYDIGCGMCAVPTTFKRDAVAKYAVGIFNSIYSAVPVGFSHNQKDSVWDFSALAHTTALAAIFAKNGLRQLASLGGGNHFIEIGYDEDDAIWIIIHSGSRGIGHAVATHYMKLASGDGKAREGHFGFAVDLAEGRNYADDLAFCLAFALENRHQIIQRVVQEMTHYCEGSADWGRLINRNHNHAELKDGLWIHRKGATHAEAGMMGVIPGNMRDGSFIVVGKGNPAALWSSSHGAGRVLGRKAAQRSLSVDQFTETMRGVVAKVDAETLDESPFAYKDIFDVMRQQADMVEIKHHIRPLINIKG